VAIAVSIIIIAATCKTGRTSVENGETPGGPDPTELARTAGRGTIDDVKCMGL
jgi:hypothetical protein